MYNANTRKLLTTKIIQYCMQKQCYCGWKFSHTNSENLLSTVT